MRRHARVHETDEARRSGESSRLRTYDLWYMTMGVGNCLRAGELYLGSGWPLIPMVMPTRLGFMKVSMPIKPTRMNAHQRSALRVEFLKSRARAQRFAEEVQILQEEQRRVLRSLTLDAQVWERRAELAL